MTVVREDRLSTLLAERGHVVLDGGLATALEEAGHRLDDSLWSARLLVDDPEAIVRAHRTFVEAGADVAITASYQASHDGFAALGLRPEETDRLLARSVDLAREAGATVVAASVGPYGAFLADGSEYTGAYGVGAPVLERFHRRRLETLAGAGPDVLACETIPSIGEVAVLLDLLTTLRVAAPAWISVTCGDGRTLRDGSSIREVGRLCQGHPGVVAVGVNCTAPGDVGPALAELAAATTLPLVAYPNSGEVYDASSKSWSGDRSGKRWLANVDGWYEAGARVIGGCCRVGPATIMELRARLASRAGR